jgi:uncharacterized protein (DUF1697 family)
MATWISLLRGINVSGERQLKMDIFILSARRWKNPVE